MLFARNSSLHPTDVFLHTTGVNHRHHLQQHDPMHCSCHINYNSQLASKSRSHTHWLHRKVERNPATRWGDKTSHSPHQDLWFPAPPVIMPAINRFYRQSKLEDGLLVIKSDNPKLYEKQTKLWYQHQSYPWSSRPSTTGPTTPSDISCPRSWKGISLHQA